MPSLTPLGPAATRSEEVADAIRAAILSGHLRPGDTLVERRLADQLGVSKTPVREALISLAASGLVVLTPTRGSTVRELDAQALRQVYDVRLLLEPWAVSTTAGGQDPGPAVRARRALETARGLLADPDHAELSLVNREFHRALYTGCGNPFVSATLDGVRDLSALAAVSLVWSQPSWRTEFEEHERILDAVEGGDAATAAALTREHIERSGQRAAAAVTAPSTPATR
ncbi:GntR family transcriptional regulator [Kutzneria viridogrisea]|uniref:HTH gntR-type domain-containing protein n=2 Tax=Kutzneria TaxID=43356 RepID=W5W7I1_9PSEU|nr:GntR family transcriptional regulator [Kutzneria albida]AHH96892.1 hypothetical protein KALB_3528 [Kutzneria albida DSM 43870]MBA8927885.1 DNA-binding GntR family transcriptional regulator [Kutzneria viridogrisea]